MNEGEVVLTPEQIQTLRGYAFRGDTYGGWRWVTVMRIMLPQLSVRMQT
ncbi:putative iron-regulated protein FrpC [Neisseria meningitidis 96060]|nr:putative iron-regulated protein FrpC [Neisseria meningitidis 96060]